MEELLAIIQNLGSNGIGVVIIGCFLWDWYSNKKENNVAIKQVADSNSNIAKSLELLQQSLNNQDTFLTKHDERCYEIQKEIAEINAKIELQK